MSATPEGPRERLMLNTYGRRCFDAGVASLVTERDDLDRWWAGRLDSLRASHAEAIAQLTARCSQQEAKLMRLEGETVARWQRIEQLESEVATLTADVNRLRGSNA